MESPTVQSTVIDDRTLQELKNEIKQEMQNIVSNSNLRNVLEKYGIPAQDVLKLECTLDLNQLQSNDVGVHEQTKSFLQAFPDLKLHKLCMVLRKPCPYDNNPDGCWSDC
ncbi:hypothetical protein [Nostoc sp.]|uniref:hypothetical protein n=1 Tax=Nostoc sp. TaxID=1180 RepID=UPI002FFA813D